ncbi:hypothetical protein EJP82_01025 [Paenibacillus anaericanus]|uniref:YopX protein domain-containing protein n=1 Tax=Paenibacillus anaericanus TaxID=170367 RepID=A0A433YFB1_9BACL|nr:YopX family protein [Paenibacillus anaericanus]RUT48556.1 hypothetical protein EJP82_01025 [Paenibacillus anaericanus]
MREYEFRAKSIEPLVGDDQWLYGFGVHVVELSDGGKEYWLYTANGTYQVDPETVGQFTRKTDFKGLKIWEGDIAKQTYHTQTGNVFDGTDFTLDGYHIGEVVITASKGVCIKNPIHYSEDNDRVEVTKQYKSIAGYRCVVIGNVHDNPELLEVQS